ncbi:IclR family transcriptional regulator [Marinovum sp.]|uniref:IclR family transcriptional regulator n=1 Tax=Marinovum sp. TaxID=2024839 RepID=UPI002B267EB6|nr:IclR family transcriptional regulator [Marinovum sp.]
MTRQKPTDTATEAKYRAPALEKGLEILELLSTHQDPMTQAEIARAMDRSKNEIYRMLSTLVQHGYVSRTQGGEGYSLSLKLFATAQRYSPVARLLEVALPLMRRAARATWQSCHVGMESGGSVVIVSSVEAPGNWGLALRTGSVIGLGNSGTGRVLAAFRPEEALQDLLGHHTPALGEPELDEPRFRQELEAIRDRGFYRGASDTLVGVTNLSFPIFEPTGEVVAVLTCPYLERVDRLKTATLEETEQVIARVAQDLTGYFHGEALPEDAQS